MTDVLIIGAGPTGLTLANILAKAGRSFRLIERDAGPIQQSRALIVHSRTLELWDKLGVLSSALERGVRFNWVEFMVDGQSKGQVPFDGQGISAHPYPMVLEQSKTQRMLLDALAQYGKTPEWSTSLETFQDRTLQDGGGHVECQLKHSDGTIETATARYLVAADGASSVVRHQLGLSFEGETYDSSFFLADVKMQSPLHSDRLYVNMTKTSFFAFLPLFHEDQSGQHYRIIGSLTPEQTNHFEKSRGIGAKVSIAPEEVEAHINAYSGLHIKILESRWATVYRIHCRMTNKYRVGNVFLAGDAAHIHSPAGGQGMNTGIADGFNLGWKLVAVLNGQAHERLLESYEEERLPAAKEVLNKSDKFFEFEATTNPVLQQIKPFLMKAISGIISNSVPIRNRSFSFVSQLSVNYRNSSFVQDKTHSNPFGIGRAGDRLPYIELAHGKTTHDFIRGFEHHLLVLDINGLSSTQHTRLQELSKRYSFKLEVLAHEPALKKIAGNQTTLLLVRPDGHIAYIGPATAMTDLETYLQGLYLPNITPKRELVGGAHGRR